MGHRVSYKGVLSQPRIEDGGSSIAHCCWRRRWNCRRSTEPYRGRYFIWTIMGLSATCVLSKFAFWSMLLPGLFSLLTKACLALLADWWCCLSVNSSYPKIMAWVPLPPNLHILYIKYMYIVHVSMHLFEIFWFPQTTKDVLILSVSMISYHGALYYFTSIYLSWWG